jgi:hypothetical protein
MFLQLAGDHTGVKHKLENLKSNTLAGRLGANKDG